MRTFLFLLVSVLTAMGQSNQVFDVFSTAQGDFTNATIIRTNPAYLVVSHLNGISKVAFTNLSPELQRQFGYDPAKAAAALEQEKAQARLALQRQIEYQNALARLRGTNQQITIKALLDSYGLCDSSVGKIYLMGLPARVANYWAERDGLAAELAAERNTPATATVAGTFRNQRTLQNTLNKAETRSQQEKKAAVAGLQKQLDDLRKTEAKATTITAYPTGLKDNGIPRWQAVN